MTATREARLSRAFVALADTLTTEFDLVELLHTLVDTCTDLLDTEAGGIMLADPQGHLQLVASSSEEADLVELAQIGAQDGPCFEAFSSNRTVTVGDTAELDGRWPAFAQAAKKHGFHSVHATPMRLRTQVIGTLNLFGTKAMPLSAGDISVSQALADVATIGILQERLTRETRIVADQLQNALNSRIVIEQAKGVLSELGGLSMDDAFRALRGHARRSNLSLQTVARGVVDRTIEVVPTR